MVISASYILHHLCFQNICNVKKSVSSDGGRDARQHLLKCWFVLFFLNATNRKHVIRDITRFVDSQ